MVWNTTAGVALRKRSPNYWLKPGHSLNVIHLGTRSMLTNSDVNYYRVIVRDPWWVRGILVITLPAFFVVLALMQLYSAAQLANGAELSLADVIQAWYLMPESRTYHALEAAAIKTIERSFSMLLLALAFAATSLALISGRAREKRIATVLGAKELLGGHDA